MCQLTCQAADTLDLTGRRLYLAEILVRALDLVEPQSVGESCCRALATVLENQAQEPFITNIVLEALQKLLVIMDKSTAPSQVS